MLKRSARVNQHPKEHFGRMDEKWLVNNFLLDSGSLFNPGGYVSRQAVSRYAVKTALITIVPIKHQLTSWVNHLLSSYVHTYIYDLLSYHGETTYYRTQFRFIPSTE